MKIRQNIPNALTCGNLLCGCLAIVQAFEGNLVWSAYLVGIAAVLDFFDGFTARLLKVSSPIGKDLDSLADMVTFGVVPGIVIFQLIKTSVLTQTYLPSTWTPENHFGDTNTLLSANSWVIYIVFIIPVFSAIRLAIFNNDTKQSESFIGLPTPANAIFICSLPLIVNQFSDQQNTIIEMIYNPYFLITLSIILSFLLVAPIPLFALKFKQFKFKGNEIRYGFLVAVLVLLTAFQFIGIPFTIILYIILSVVNNSLKKSPSAP